jgi:hypothetical protein
VRQRQRRVHRAQLGLRLLRGPLVPRRRCRRHPRRGLARPWRGRRGGRPRCAEKPSAGGPLATPRRPGAGNGGFRPHRCQRRRGFGHRRHVPRARAVLVLPRSCERGDGLFFLRLAAARTRSPSQRQRSKFHKGHLLVRRKTNQPNFVKARISPLNNALNRRGGGGK